MSYSTQKKTGVEQNKLYSEDTPIHDWYRFVLSYPPHLVRNYIEKFKLTEKDCILDPFCGTGTTLVEAKKHRISSIGIEANPVVHMAAEAKTQWNIDTQALRANATEIATEAKRRLEEHKEPALSLSFDEEKLLITNSISPIPLHKALMLLRVMADLKDARFSNVLKTAFAKQAVFGFSNLRFGPEVGVSRKKKLDAPVIDMWLEQVEKIAADLSFFSRKVNSPSTIHLADARKIGQVIQPNSIDAVITSPPYPNEKDYSRTTRLESVLLGFMSNRKDLRSHKENLLRSNTRNVYKDDDDSIWVKDNERVQKLSREIEQMRIKLGKTSGFERLYHKVVTLYFGGMARHLDELKPKLRDGAQLAYVVGDQASYFRIPIRTGEILAGIAQDLGYEVTNIDLFRTRLSTATGEQLREEIVLLKWRG